MGTSSVLGMVECVRLAKLTTTLKENGILKEDYKNEYLLFKVKDQYRGDNF